MSEDGHKKTPNNPEALAVQNIMKNEGMRNYMWKHLQEAGVFESIFDADSIKHAYNAGKRQHGLVLDDDLRQYAPDDYIKMIKENI